MDQRQCGPWSNAAIGGSYPLAKQILGFPASDSTCKQASKNLEIAPGMPFCQQSSRVDSKVASHLLLLSSARLHSVLSPFHPLTTSNPSFPHDASPILDAARALHAQGWSRAATYLKTPVEPGTLNNKHAAVVVGALMSTATVVALSVQRGQSVRPHAFFQPVTFLIAILMRAIPPLPSCPVSVS